MLSWVFRHRSRLEVVYGRVDSPPLPGQRFSGGGVAPLLPLERPGGIRPGEVGLAGRAVTLRPMPPRVRRGSR